MDEKYDTDLLLPRSCSYDFADGNDFIKFGFMDKYIGTQQLAGCYAK